MLIFVEHARCADTTIRFLKMPADVEFMLFRMDKFACCAIADLLCWQIMPQKIRGDEQE